MTSATLTTDSSHGVPGYSDRRDSHLRRLHKIEGQVRGITRMVNEERYCIDVLTQVSAVTRALQEVAMGLLDDHLRHCVVDAARSDSADAQVKLDELTTTLRRAMRI
jgi:CsoR family transcriptional regulator, copper-sensing transcriptional repressor